MWEQDDRGWYYKPNNADFYDSDDNYEPDNEFNFQDLWLNPEHTVRKRSYTTADVMGYEGSGVPEGVWYRMREIPDSFISSFGAIWSDSLGRFREPKKLYMNRPNHPYWVVYSKEGMFYMHRLMATYFIPNPENYPVVRHLNDDGLDYRLENLAWGTQRDNYNDAVRNGTYKLIPEYARIKGNQMRSKPVIAINLETGEETWYPSQRAAARGCGTNQSEISVCITGKCKNKFIRTRKYSFREAEK